jgi:hypothetical protein
MTMLLKPTVLILGATGQIGRFILGHLKQEPDAVHIRVVALASVMLRDKAGQSNSKSCLSPTTIVSLPNSSGSWRGYIEYNQASEQPCSQNSNKSLQTLYAS